MTDVAATLKERGHTHGDFSHNAECAQLLKRTAGNAVKATGKALTDDQWEALDLICTKLARICTGDPNHADNWVDIAGYATLVAMRLGK